MNHCQCAYVLAAPAILGTFFLLAATSLQDEKPANAVSTLGPVNSACPFTDRPIGADSPTQAHNGYTIGFCCNGCQSRWQGLTEENKDAILAKFVPQGSTDLTSTSGSAPDGLSIARDYLKGMEAGQLDGLDRLFLPDGRSSVLENASDEGSWERYRDHHLKPEMESATNFKFTVTDEKAERFGSAVLVRQIGRFTVQVEQEVRAYRAAVTYVIVEDTGELKIAHLHWSSRPGKN